MNIQDPELAPQLIPTHAHSEEVEEVDEVETVIPAPAQRLAALEAMLFASPGPVRISELLEATGWKPRMLDGDLESLEQSLNSRGIELQRVAGAVRLVTRGQTASFVERLIGVQTRRRLTRAQLETLAVVAYRQPATRADAESLRGVSCERVLGQLCDLRLIREVGRAELPGRPLLYGTTPDFLRYFGLNNLEALPDIHQLKRTQPPPGVSASQASWNAAARGEADNPTEAAPMEPARLGTMQPIAAEVAGAAGGPSPGLLKLFDKIRGKKPVVTPPG